MRRKSVSLVRNASQSIAIAVAACSASVERLAALSEYSSLLIPLIAQFINVRIHIDILPNLFAQTAQL